LDAVAFLWKEVGSPSIHLPQTHEVIRLWRTLANYAEEEIVLITETNVPNHENLSYFGNQNEAHMVYNFSLPPLTLQALMSGNSAALRRWMMSMPPSQEGCAYFNFTASHDGVGLRPAEGLLAPEEIGAMLKTVQSFGGQVSMRDRGDGIPVPYEMNISLFEACKGTIHGEDEHQIARFLCSQTIMFALEGLPAVYIHSLLATPNDTERYHRTGQNRSLNRHKWHMPSLSEKLADSESDQSKVFAEMSRRLRIRARQAAFHPNATQFTLSLPPELFGFWRQSRDRRQSIFAINNLSDQTQTLALHDINLIAGEDWLDLLTNETVGDRMGVLELSPYQSVWITNQPGT
jgi:sucrose phosphorylase